MLNYIWASMILIGIFVGMITGSLDSVGQSALDSATEAITVAIAMLGIMSLWTGLMKIAENSGLIDSLTNSMGFILKYLFPKFKKGSLVLKYISTNIIANILGLGWAATPAGLKAMEEMQKLNPNPERATKEMCMFLIINMSSLQLVTISVIAFRSQYGSNSPSEIIGPGILVTFISSIFAIIFAKIMERTSKE